MIYCHTHTFYVRQCILFSTLIWTDLLTWALVVMSLPLAQRLRAILQISNLALNRVGLTAWTAVRPAIARSLRPLKMLQSFRLSLHCTFTAASAASRRDGLHACVRIHNSNSVKIAGISTASSERRLTTMLFGRPEPPTPIPVRMRYCSNANSSSRVCSTRLLHPCTPS